jgi:hypothetical protein
MDREAQAKWELEHMTAWVTLERAKGRPESELTWDNCVRETGVLVERGGHLFIEPRRGSLVPLPGDLTH